MNQQSGPGEDSTSLVAHRHRAQASHRRRRPRILITVTAAAVLLIGGGTAFVLLSGPSYPHPWCAPMLAELHSKSGTEQAYEATMAQIQQQDHAPVGKLLSDLYAYDADEAAVQTGSNLSALGNIASATTALSTVGADLRVLNRECGQPASAAGHEAI